MRFSFRAFVPSLFFGPVRGAVCIHMFERPESLGTDTAPLPLSAFAAVSWYLVALTYGLQDWFGRMSIARSLANGGLLLGFLSSFVTGVKLGVDEVTVSPQQESQMDYFEFACHVVYEMVCMLGFSGYPMNRNPGRWLLAGMAAGLVLHYIGRMNARGRYRGVRTFR